MITNLSNFRIRVEYLQALNQLKILESKKKLLIEGSAKQSIIWRVFHQFSGLTRTFLSSY